MRRYIRRSRRGPRPAVAPGSGPRPFPLDVGHPAPAFRSGTAAKALRGDDAAEKIARTMALRAMAEAVDQISPAIPGHRVRGIGNERLVVHEQELPDSDVAADVERKRQVVIAHL